MRRLISSARLPAERGPRRPAETCGTRAATCATASSPTREPHHDLDAIAEKHRAVTTAAARQRPLRSQPARGACASGRNPTPSDPVHGAQKPGDEPRARPQVDILGRADLLDAAGVHHRDAESDMESASS